MEIGGRCHCGQITYRATVDPGRVRICHCADCQMLSGSPFRVVLPVAEADFELTAGAPKTYVKRAESGVQRLQAFCGTCGTPLWATSNDAGPRTLGLRWGSIAERAALMPKRQFWQRSAVDWLDKIAAAEGWETQ